MTRYLIQASYTAEGVRGLLKNGGSDRRAAVAKMIEGLGGVSECFYYAFGENDVYAIAQLPDNATAAAVSLAITASGAVTSNIVVLLTPEEMTKRPGRPSPTAPRAPDPRENAIRSQRPAGPLNPRVPIGPPAALRAAAPVTSRRTDATR
jgi:uncharacterized protein with GYD domain